MNNIYDLTKVLNENTPIYPGDPCFQSTTLSSVSKGDAFASQKLQFCNHSGTHIDFPSHIIKAGKTSLDFPINHFMGEGIIIEVSPQPSSPITPINLKNQDIRPKDIVFFKNAAFLDMSAAELLLEMEVKIVGIDNLSIDAIGEINLPVHHLLLSNNILIVESLELQNSPLGRCKILVAPLLIESDGAPARVIMWA